MPKPRRLLNVDGGQELSGSWASFTQLTVLNGKPPMGTRGPRARLTNVHATSRPDYLWPEVWSSMSKATQQKKRAELGG